MKPIRAELAHALEVIGSARERQVQSEVAVVRALARIAALALASSGRSRIMAECARALGMERNTLDVYAPLARMSLEEIQDALRRTNNNGWRICRSHLLLLAPLPASQREIMLQRALEGELSVRALRALLADSPTGPTPPAPPTPETPPEPPQDPSSMTATFDASQTPNRPDSNWRSQSGRDAEFEDCLSDRPTSTSRR
jgi:hypothetical protein